VGRSVAMMLALMVLAGAWTNPGAPAIGMAGRDAPSIPIAIVGDSYTTGSNEGGK